MLMLLFDNDSSCLFECDSLCTVMRLFILSMDVQSPTILECISLPCLRILHHIIKPSPAISKKNKVCVLLIVVSVVNIDRPVILIVGRNIWTESTHTIRSGKVEKFDKWLGIFYVTWSVRFNLKHYVASIFELHFFFFCNKANTFSKCANSSQV